MMHACVHDFINHGVCRLVWRLTSLLEGVCPGRRDTPFLRPDISLAGIVPSELGQLMLSAKVDVPHAVTGKSRA